MQLTIPLETCLEGLLGRRFRITSEAKTLLGGLGVLVSK